MTDEIKNESAPTPTPAAAPSSEITAERLAQAMARAEAAESKLSELKSSETAKAHEAAQSEALAQIEALTEKATASEAKWLEAEKRALRATTLNHLPGLINSAYLAHAPEVQLTESGDLTEESLSRLEEFKASHPELFKATKPLQQTSTPMASAGKAQAWTDRDIRTFRSVGMKPGAATEHNLSWLVGFKGD